MLATVKAIIVCELNIDDIAGNGICAVVFNCIQTAIIV